MLKNNDSKNYVPISNIVDIYLGGTPSRAESKYWGQGIKWASATDIATCESRYLRKTKEQITELGLQKSAAKLLGKNTVLITARGTVGALCMLPEPMSFNQTCYGLVCHYELDPTYLYFALKARIQHIKSQTYGAVFDTITIKSFDFITIPLPTLSTQRKIAAILSAYDDLIENNTRRIKILEEMAQAIYREWFVHFRFPGHEGVKMVETELGLAPEGWEVKKLGEIAYVNPDAIKKGFEPDVISYVDIASVSPGRIDKVESMRFVDAPGRARRIVQHGDIIWSCVRPNRKSYSLIINPVPNMIVSTGFAVLRPRRIHFSYLYHAVSTKEFVGYLTNHATGAAYPAVTAADFENALILLPPNHLCKKFHKIVEDSYILVDLLNRRCENLRITRDLLLPKVVSGELDVRGAVNEWENE